MSALMLNLSLHSLLSALYCFTMWCLVSMGTSLNFSPLASPSDRTLIRFFSSFWGHRVGVCYLSRLFWIFAFSGQHGVNIRFFSSRPAAARPLLSLPSVNKLLLFNMKKSSVKGLVMSFLSTHPAHPPCPSLFRHSPTVPPPAPLRATCSFLVSFVVLPWKRMYSFTIRYNILCFSPVHSRSYKSSFTYRHIESNSGSVSHREINKKLKGKKLNN